jgi:hypothetical protein
MAILLCLIDLICNVCVLKKRHKGIGPKYLKKLRVDEKIARDNFASGSRNVRSWVLISRLQSRQVQSIKVCLRDRM